jgi:HSP20 family protein
MLWSEGFGTLGRGLETWTELERMQNEMNRLFARLGSTPSQDFPAANVWANEERAVVTTELPGIAPDAIEISVAGKTLTIRGSREPAKAGEGESYHRQERWYGTFTKALEIPFPVDPAKVEAKFNKGVLAISLPRLEVDKPKKITVKIEKA